MPRRSSHQGEKLIEFYKILFFGFEFTKSNIYFSSELRDILGEYNLIYISIRVGENVIKCFLTIDCLYASFLFSASGGPGHGGAGGVCVQKKRLGTNAIVKKLLYVPYLSITDKKSQTGLFPPDCSAS